MAEGAFKLGVGDPELASMKQVSAGNIGDIGDRVTTIPKPKVSKLANPNCSLTSKIYRYISWNHILPSQRLCSIGPYVFAALGLW